MLRIVVFALFVLSLGVLIRVVLNDHIRSMKMVEWEATLACAIFSFIINLVVFFGSIVVGVGFNIGIQIP